MITKITDDTSKKQYGAGTLTQTRIESLREAAKVNQRRWVEMPKSTLHDLLNKAEAFNAMIWARKKFGGLKSCFCCPLQTESGSCKMECDDIVKYQESWLNAFREEYQDDQTQN